jgi:hypothetical protein
VQKWDRKDLVCWLDKNKGFDMYPGADSFHMEIAGVDFSISAKKTGKMPGILVQEHEPGYQSFFFKSNIKNRNPEPGTLSINVSLELVNGNMPDSRRMPKLFDSGQSWWMTREADVYWAVLHPPAHEKPLWAARFNPDVKDVTVYCSPQLIQEQEGKTIILNPVRYPLDQLLMMYILARHQGVVFHAAGIKMSGKGFIFAGPSGAGKSTLARLFNASLGQNKPGVLVLSDERIVTRNVNGTFKAYGTPWHGEEGTTRNTSVPLSGIFFLYHSSQNRVKPLKPQQALERLLQVTSIPWYDRDILPGILRYCEELLNRVPLFEFHFTPGLEAIRFLETCIRDHLKYLLIDKPYDIL